MESVTFSRCHLFSATAVRSSDVPFQGEDQPVPMPSRTLIWIALVALASAAAAQQPPPTAPPASSAIKIPFETYTLPNGLTVILSQDRTTPTVAVSILYHVGSKNEVPGRTGFAHLFEHIMFTGSGHVPYGLHDKLTEGVGGNNNGGTSNDTTMLLRDGAVQLPRVGAVAGVRQDGLPARHARPRQAERAARHRQERAPPGGRQPALRQGRRDPGPGDLPGEQPVLLGRHRQHGRPERGVGRRCEGFLPNLLRAEQRVPVDRGRLRPGAGEGVGHEVLRRHLARQARGAAECRPCHPPRGAPVPLRGPHPGVASLSAVADGRREERRLVRPRRARQHPGRAAHRPSHQGAGIRPAGGGQHLRLPGFERGRRRVLGRRHAAAGPHADRTRDRHRWNHREAEGGGADGGGGPEGDCRRGAELRAGPRVQPRQGDEPRDGRRLPRRRRLLQDGLPEVDVGHRGGCQARGQQVPDERPRRPERGAERQGRRGIQAGC